MREYNQISSDGIHAIAFSLAIKQLERLTGQSRKDWSEKLMTEAEELAADQTNRFEEKEMEIDDWPQALGEE